MYVDFITAEGYCDQVMIPASDLTEAAALSCSSLTPASCRPERYSSLEFLFGSYGALC